MTTKIFLQESKFNQDSNITNKEEIWVMESICARDQVEPVREQILQ